MGVARLRRKQIASRGRFWTLVALGLSAPAPAVWAYFHVEDVHERRWIALCTLVSLVGLVATTKLVPIVQWYTLRKGMFGYDLNKVGTPRGKQKIPEAMGLASGVVFLVCVVIFQQFHFSTNAQSVTSSDWLIEYNAALATICFMLFLGFVDDVLDIPWRSKLILPACAALPLIVAYRGGSTIVIPKPVRHLLFGLDLLELGIIYKLYMLMMTIFCTNSINILAGINGLEAGQSFIIGCSVLLFNMLQLSGQGLSTVGRDAHVFSAYIMIPQITTTFGLLMHNWYPSSVFVGDTYTYFAGMTFAVVGILGHFSEMILLFFLPQILNFLYSVPQLFKLVPCPRHRLPSFDPATGKLHATPNWNLVNLALRLFGPMGEQKLCLVLLAFQSLCCGAAFLVRHIAEGYWK